jgi:hypothetical protein
MINAFSLPLAMRFMPFTNSIVIRCYVMSKSSVIIKRFAVTKSYWLTLGMLEAEKRRVEIRDINPISLQTIIEFAYTAKAVITIDNVQNLLFASTVLQTEDLAEACSSFLRQHLSLSNCTEIRQYAELLNRKSLIDLADEFIRDHFLEIVQIEDFYRISFRHLKVGQTCCSWPN